MLKQPDGTKLEVTVTQIIVPQKEIRDNESGEVKGIQDKLFFSLSSSPRDDDEKSPAQEDEE